MTVFFSHLPIPVQLSSHLEIFYFVTRIFSCNEIIYFIRNYIFRYSYIVFCLSYRIVLSVMRLLNPLTANDKYIGHLAGAACRRRSAFHRQNHEKRPPNLNWKLCILVDPFLKNCVTKSNFRYFLKKSPKKGSGT